MFVLTKQHILLVHWKMYLHRLHLFANLPQIFHIIAHYLNFIQVVVLLQNP